VGDATDASNLADRLRGRLEALAGVERAMVEGPPWVVWLVCASDAGDAPLEASVPGALSAAGLDPSSVVVRTAFLGSPAPRRRVRLVDAIVEHPDSRSAAATVRLEWNGTTRTGKASGEGGPGGDLRVCAMATLDALGQILPDLPAVRLVGIRGVHVFDRDLVVALLRVTEPRDQSLLGASLATEERALSVARSVLNGLNRLLGNYLSIAD
jgi:hypothetical protein